MKLTKRSRYAVRALIEIAQNYNIRPTSRKEITEMEDISDSFLKDILIALKNNGIIHTVRGPGGGYHLTRSPENVTLFDIIASQESTLAPVGCINEKDYCEKSEFCSSRKIWEIFYTAIKKSLQGITLQNAIEAGRTSIRTNCSKNTFS